MNTKYWQQMKQRWRTNPLFSTISVFATALTITFVMALYMVYSFRTADIAPEVYRSRTLYSDDMRSYMTKDQSHRQSGMSKRAALKIFSDLSGAESVSYIMNKGEGAAYVGTSPANSAKRVVSPVDDQYFKIFRFDFIAGHPFSREQSESEARVAVITDKMASELFGTAEEAIGKNVIVQFGDYRVVGVVHAVSALFNNAYSDVWIVAGEEQLNAPIQYQEGLIGKCQVLVVAKEGVPLSRLKDEINTRLEEMNEGLSEYTFELKMRTQSERSFFNGEVEHPFGIFILLIVILLVVPSINMTGLLSTWMKKRNSEIGIRKAYGAGSGRLALELMMENLSLTLIGGVIGLLLSFVVLIAFRDVLLADLMTINVHGDFDLPISAFVNPWVYLLTVLFCAVINLLSAIIPVWHASRISIIQTIKGE